MTHRQVIQPLLAISLTSFTSLTMASPVVEEILVTSGRVDKPLSTIPNTVTLIDETELQGQLSVHYDLSTVLGNLIPSFSPSRQKMTNAGETLRGRKPLYMIDGVPQSTPLREGGRDGHTIDPAMLDRIEVLHGANAIHGLGASGGIINLITRKPTAGLQQGVRLATSWQSEDIGESANYGVSYHLSNRFNNADVLAGLSYRQNGIAYDANGQVIGADNTQGDTMDAKTINGLLKLGYDWQNQRIELMANHFDIQGDNNWISVPGDVAAGIPSGATKGRIEEGHSARNQATTLSLNYTHANLFGQQLRVQLFSLDFAATYGAEATPLATFQDPAYGADLIDQSQNNSEKLGVKITLAKDKIANLPVNWVYGLDLLRDETWQALILTGRTWVPKSQYENIAPFAQVEFDGIEQLILTAGVRHEKSTLKVGDFTTLASSGSQFVEGGKPDFSKTLFNAGGVYQLTQQWRLFANYAEAFSMPDVGRVLRGINTAGQSVETFLDLKPILTENTEVGVEFNHHRFNTQLTYYTSESDFGQRLERGVDGIFTVAREQTEVKGWEFRSQWFVSNVDTLGLRYANSQGRYDASGDGRVDTDLGGANIAPNRANLSWDRNWQWGLATRLQVNHLFDRRFKNQQGDVTAEFDGYTTVDFNADIPAFNGSVTLGIHNLTNRDYFTYHAQTNPNNIRNFKGIGRSFSLGYQLSL